MPWCTRVTVRSRPSARSAARTPSWSGMEARGWRLEAGGQFHRQLDAADSQPIAAAELTLVDAPIVDEGAVGARQVLDVDAFVGRDDTAVQSRHERGVDDEVGARRAPDSLG